MGANPVATVLDALLNEARMAKQAGATSTTHDGPTTHPVATAPNNQIAATQGSRSAENQSDVAAMVGEAAVDRPKDDAESATSKKPTDSIGTETQDADEVTGNATSSSEAARNTEPAPDESESHPTQGLFTGGPAQNKVAALDALIDGCNKIAADVAVLVEKASGDSGVTQAVQTASTPETSPTAKADDATAQTPEGKQAAQPTKTSEADKPEEEKQEEAEEKAKKEAMAKHADDMQAGYEAAEQLMSVLGSMPAPQQQDLADVQQITKLASDDADRYIRFIQGFQDGTGAAEVEPSINKEAAGKVMAALKALKGAAGRGAKAIGEKATGAAKAVGRVAKEKPKRVAGAGLLGAGGLAGGAAYMKGRKKDEEKAAGALTDDALAMALGGGGAAAPMAAPAEEEAVETDEEAVADALASALEEAGIPPEEFAQAVAEMAAEGGEAVADEEEDLGAEEEAAAPEGGMEVAASASNMLLGDLIQRLAKRRGE